VTSRRLILAALAIGVSCGAMVSPPLVGPQPRGVQCGECQPGLSCEWVSFSLLRVCARACDAGCVADEVCSEGLCHQSCRVSADCDSGDVLLACTRRGDAGVCLAQPCAAEDCGAGYACTSSDRGEIGCQPRATNFGVCRKN